MLHVLTLVAALFEGLVACCARPVDYMSDYGRIGVLRPRFQLNVCPGKLRGLVKHRYSHVQLCQQVALYINDEQINRQYNAIVDLYTV